MDPAFGILILAVAATPILALAGFLLALNMRTRMRTLEWRLAQLERGFAARPATASPAAAEEPSVEQAPQPEPPREAVAATPEPPRATPPMTPRPSLEERLGARWAVWVGGLALALGGIFLVRYTIEQGLLGPAARIALGALLAVVLLAGGEWLRRRERKEGIAGIPAAHIPSILTAAGTTVAYATTYAAYALYGFLPAAAAFIVLGAVALATLAAALLHGPALAALGLIGAYVTPALVASAEPSYWALYLYLTVVTAAAFALASVRVWSWLALAAVALSFAWGGAGLMGGQADGMIPIGFHAAAGFALAAIFLVPGLLYGPSAEPGQIDRVSTIGILVPLLLAAWLVVAYDHDGLTLFVFVLLVTATILIAWRAEAATAIVPGAAVLSALVLGDWAVNPPDVSLVAPGVPSQGLPLEPVTQATLPHLMLGAGLAALFGVSGFLAQGRFERPMAPTLWAAAAAIAPIAILIALYYRIAGFDRSIPFGLAALALAGLYGYATELLMRRPSRPGIGAASAIFATAATAFLALGFTFAMEKGWLTVALALMAFGAASVERQRPLPALRWLAAGLGVVVGTRIGWDPRIVGNDLGTTPVFNWLLWGYGVPALAFWRAGALLRRRADDLPARILDALAILFTVLLLGFEIRHYVHGGDIYSGDRGLAETGLQAAAAFALAIGLDRARRRTTSVVYDAGAQLALGLALVIAVVGLGLDDNPLLTGESVGGRVFNLILLGYGLPAILAAILAYQIRDRRPPEHAIAAAVAALALLLAYVSIEIRRLFQGESVILSNPTSPTEWYTYSAAWLVLGVVLLVAGLVTRSRNIRIASAAVIVLTVLKVFLSDLANLEGALRALSFIGLGFVLIGIGWLYQRLLVPGSPATPDPTPGS